jgi:putative salt-induced outer membrane protein YdiY
MHAHASRFVCRVVFFSLTALLLAVAPAFADVLQLMNGDRITGQVVSLAGGTLVFKTAGGDINIPWNQITSIESTATLQVTIAGRPGKQTITGMTMGTPGQLVLTPGGQVALADVTDLGPLEKTLTITGGANAGILNSGGNTDSFSLHLDGDIAVRQNLNRYTATALVNRVQDRLLDLYTARNWSTAFNYDRFLSKRLFVNANAIYTNDEFRDLDLRSAYGVGLGYQVFDTPTVKLTANAGLGWVKENFIVADDNDYTAARESASLDIFAIPHRVEFFHKHDGYFGLKGDDNLFIRTHNGVRLTVIKNFVTTVQWDVDYDASPSPGLKATDTTFALTFGYRF